MCNGSRESLKNKVVPTQAIWEVSLSPVTITVGCTLVQGKGFVKGELMRMIFPLRLKPT
jgi:hypothetical protein